MAPRPTILIVEDDVHLAEITCEIMELAGVEAVYRTTIAEGMEFLARNAVATVALFTDINLASPMTGIELAVYVSEEWPDIAICVTSGLMLERPSRLPAKAVFLAKPWRLNDVTHFAETAARRHQSPCSPASSSS